MPLPGLPGGTPYQRGQSTEAKPVGDGTHWVGVTLFDGAELADDERGIVLPPMVYEGGQITGGQNVIDPQLLRYGLGFWDCITVVDAGVPLFNGYPQVEDGALLFEQGLLRRAKAVVAAQPNMSVTRYVSGQSFGPAFAGVLAFLEGQHPGKWTFGKEDGRWSAEGPDTTPAGIINFKLTRALSIPRVDVPIHEVLEFKYSRSAELQALRAELRDTQDRISNAEDWRAVEAIELKRLDDALIAHMRVSKEWRFPVSLVNQKMKITSKTADLAAKFFAAAAVGGAPIPAALLAGLIGGAFGSFEAEVIRTQPPQQNSPFEYAAEFLNEIVA